MAPFASQLKLHIVTQPEIWLTEYHMRKNKCQPDKLIFFSYLKMCASQIKKTY